jgi:hypothetical protein
MKYKNKCGYVVFMRERMEQCVQRAKILPEINIQGL